METPTRSPGRIVGAIEVEASPWVEDNLWILEQMQVDPLFVGTIGDLQPEKEDFAELFDRYRKNPLFLGLRCGNLWGRRLGTLLGDRRFVDGLRRLAEADMVMDTADPSMDLLAAVVRASDAVPGLRIVLDQRDRHAVTQEGWNAADRSDAALAVVEREAALRGRVVLQNLGDAESRLEGLPNLRAQSVAAAQAQRMLRLVGLRRPGEQIAAQLTDVLKERALVGDDILPEAPRRESVAQKDRTAVDQRRSDRHDAAHTVIHGQTVIHAVCHASVEKPCEPVAPLHDTVVTDIRRLR